MDAVSRRRGGWRPELLRQRRESHGFTLEHVAEAVRNLTGHGFKPPDATFQSVGRHERGDVYPGTRYQRAYCLVYGATEPELGFRLPLPDEQPHVAGPLTVTSRFNDVPDVTSSWQQHHAGPLTRPGTGEDATNRRDLIGLLASTGATAAATPVLSPAARLLALEQTASGTGALALAEAQLTSVVSAYPTTPPPELLGRIVAMQGFTDGVAQLSLRPADTARLWRLASIGAGLRGWVHNNAGDTDAARESLAEAHKRADLLDDHQLIAWTRYMQSVVEDYAGNPTAAEQYALDGLRFAPNGPQRAILLADSIAGTRAIFGDLDGVDRAVDEARQIVDGLPADQRSPANGTIVDNLDTYDHLMCASVCGLAYSRLGRVDRFTQVTTEARLAADSSATKHRSFFRMDQAMAIANSPDPDPESVASLARQGLDLATPYQTAHIGTRLVAILKASAPLVAHPAIRELTEHARSWRTARAVSRPELLA